MGCKPALENHQKAAKALKEGFFRGEIMPGRNSSGG
jgi:acetyl-CoA acetyltransferase